MYNPILLDEDYAANATYTEVPVDNKTSVVRLYPVSGTRPRVYINDLSNTPAISLYEAMTLSNHDGQINCLYIYGAAAVVVNVKCITTPRGEIVRVGVNA